MIFKNEQYYLRHKDGVWELWWLKHHELIWSGDADEIEGLMDNEVYQRGPILFRRKNYKIELLELRNAFVWEALFTAVSLVFVAWVAWKVQSVFSLIWGVGGMLTMIGHSLDPDKSFIEFWKTFPDRSWRVKHKFDSLSDLVKYLESKPT